MTQRFEEETAQYGQSTTGQHGSHGGQLGQQGGGQQFGGSQIGQGGMTQPMEQVASQRGGEKFEDHLTSELKMCLDDCLEVEQVAEWCADNCIEMGPQMANCARLCKETADLADLTAKFISRDAFTAPYVAEVFAEVAEETLQELDRQQAPHTQETAAVVNRAIDSTYQALDTIGGQQIGGQQIGGQQMSGQGQVGQQFGQTPSY